MRARVVLGISAVFFSIMIGIFYVTKEKTTSVVNEKEVVLSALPAHYKRNKVVSSFSQPTVAPKESGSKKENCAESLAEHVCQRMRDVGMDPTRLLKVSIY